MKLVVVTLAIKVNTVGNMVYLGHMVTEDGKNEPEIKRRIVEVHFITCQRF